MLPQILLATTTLFVSTRAAYPSALIAIERGSLSNNDLKNTTLTIPLNSIYKNPTELSDISTLYLLSGEHGASTDQISCTPFVSTSGAGKHADIFSSHIPSHIALDTRSNGGRIGSIVCISGGISQGPGLGNPGSSSSTAGSAHHTHTSTTLVTHTPRPQTLSGAGHGYTSKSIAGPTGATASPSASQSAGNAASAIYLSGEFFGGLAIAGFGVAFAL